jgi:hypothetical protein
LKLADPGHYTDMEPFFTPTVEDHAGDPIQALWRMENEALRRGEPLPSPGVQCRSCRVRDAIVPRADWSVISSSQLVVCGGPDDS